jgi:hypothetical protein
LVRVVSVGAAWRSAKEVNGELSSTVKTPKPSIVAQDCWVTRFLAMPMNSPPLGTRYKRASKIKLGMRKDGPNEKSGPARSTIPAITISMAMVELSGNGTTTRVKGTP